MLILKKKTEWLGNRKKEKKKRTENGNIWRGRLRDMLAISGEKTESKGENR